MEFLTGPNVILALKVAVGLVTVLLAFAVWAAWKQNYRLHGRINMAFFALTMTAVVLFELVIRVIKPGIYDYLRADPEVFQRLRVHLSFAIPSALLMPLMLWTGMRRRRMHRKLTVVFALFWTLTFITGIFFLPHKASAQVLESAYFHLGGRKVEIGFRDSIREILRGNPEFIHVSVGTVPARMSRVIVVAAADGVAVARLRDSVAVKNGFDRFLVRPFLGDVVVARFDHPIEALQAANELIEDGSARFAHPDIEYEVEARGFVAPRQEPLLARQWHMESNGTLDAWRIAEARRLVPRETVVAVLDLGFEVTHPDLDSAWLRNGGEIPGNKKDDDGNGLVDDVAGWNFSTNGNNLLYGASNKHGTATAGIIGARVNGLGVAGGCPWCRVLPVVVDNSAVNQAAAFRYAHQRGARIFSNSWGYRLDAPVTDVVVDAIRDVARDSVVVFAMSNVNINDCRAENSDISSLDDVVAVSSVTKAGIKVEDSGFGPCMELVAPSKGGPSDKANPGIVTTDRVGSAGYNNGNDPANLDDADFTNSFWGTSAAAPQVAAAAGVLSSLVPGASASDIKAAMIATARKTGGSDAVWDDRGFSQKYGYGLVDAGAALRRLLGDRDSVSGVRASRESAGRRLASP